MGRIAELREGRLSDSLSAAIAPPAPELPWPDGSDRGEVAIVGGGYTGLSTALHSAEVGREVALVDAAKSGWAASGRNGGQAIPGLKYDLDLLEAWFGPERGRRVVELAGGAADAVFALIARHRIACDAQQRGGSSRPTRWRPGGWSSGVPGNGRPAA